MRGIRRRLRASGVLAVAAVAAFAGGARAQVALPPAVEAAPLAKDAFATGILARADGALDARLWRGADPETLSFLLDAAPARPTGPALGEALRRVLLSAGETPQGAAASLGGRKLLALARAGFTEEARTIASLSNASRADPWVSQALAIADLLSGATANACRRNAGLTTGRDADFWVKLRLICYAASGERDAADLTLTLLREQGALEGPEEMLLSALATGSSPKTPAAPQNALQLAAIRQVGLPLSPGLVVDADGGVLVAIARDASLDPATRVAAANRAVVAGGLSAPELQVLYQGIELDVAELAGAVESALARPHDPLTDVLLYQSVSQMTAPEFLRDKAGRIALALSIADSVPRAYAASVLYSEEIVALEGALLTPQEAAQFSVARMAVGDGDGAARWLFAALGSGGLGAFDDAAAMNMIELVNLLAVLDPISAAAVGEAAGVEVGAPSEPASSSARAAVDEQSLGRIVSAAFDAAIEDITGQAALAALAMSNLAPAGDPVAGAVIDQSLRAAGLNELRRRIAFERAWRVRFAAAAPPISDEFSRNSPAPDEAAPASGASEDGGPSPRLKPRSSQ